MSKIKLTAHIRSLVEAAHIKLRAKGTLSEAYSLGVLPPSHPCKTGCWTYNHHTKKHEIMISPLAYDTIATPSLGSGVRKGVPKLFTEVYEHEAAHSRFTTKNLKELNDTLKKHSIPWRLMNLFEDIRIESIWSRLRRRAFKWMTWEKYPEDVSKVTPTALLYWMKNDCSGFSRRLSRDFQTTFRVLPFFNTVVKYFNRIRTSGSTENLIPVLIDWLKEFPRTSDDSITESGGLGTGDLKDAMTACGEAVLHVPKKPGDEEGETTGTSKGEEMKAHGTLSSLSEEESLSGVSGDDQKREHYLAVRLARMLATAFKGVGTTKGATSRPTSKLNLRAILRKCYDLPYIGKVIGNNGVPHLSLLIDCSGSMAYYNCFIDREKTTSLPTDRAGRVLLMALSILAGKRKIKCTAYLCSEGGVNYKTELPIKSYAQAQLARGWSSAEGFGLALSPSPAHRKTSKNCFDEVSKDRLAIIYTDGEITDNPIDRAALRERGLQTLGLCCSSIDRTKNLKEHFDYYISRESLWGLADALVRLLRSIKA
jgi:hypothetical protein